MEFADLETSTRVSKDRSFEASSLSSSFDDRCYENHCSDRSIVGGLEQVFLGYEHTAAEHLAFGTYFYYRGKGQVRGRGSGAPLPPGSARSAEEAGAMSRWARAAEKEDAVQRAFTHFQKAYEIVQRKGGKKGGALTDKEWRRVTHGDPG